MIDTVTARTTGGDANTWKPLVTQAFSAVEIDAVLSRRVPYVHVPRFLDPAWCAELVRRFNAAMDARPEYQSLVMGPMVFDTLAKPVELFADTSNPDEYFTFVAQDAPRVRELFAGGDDPLDMMRRAWQAAGWTEVPAAEDEHRYYHPDVVWGIRNAAAMPHVDTYEHDRRIALSRFDRRLNYNVYIQNADSGGEFVVYNRYADDLPPGAPPWSFERVLQPETLSDTARLAHHPAPGDLVIFDAMLYHEVTQIDGSRNQRVQLHCALLVDPAAREFLFFV